MEYDCPLVAALLLKSNPDLEMYMGNWAEDDYDCYHSGMALMLVEDWNFRKAHPASFTRWDGKIHIKPGNVKAGRVVVLKDIMYV